MSTATDLAEYLAKKARDKFIFEQLMKKAITKAPWLGLTAINPFFALVLNFLIDIFYDEAVLLLFFGITSAELAIKRQAYTHAATELAAGINKPTNELSKEELKRLSDEMDAKLASLGNNFPTR